MRQLGVSGAHRFDKGRDDFRFNAVGKMPRVGNVLEATPAVGNVLVLGERIGDQREQPQVFREGLGQRLGPRLALGFVFVLQQVERWLERQRLAIHLIAHAGHRFVVQPVEGTRRGLRFFEEEFFQLVVKLKGFLHAEVVDPRFVMRQRRTFERLCKCCVIDAIEFELEKQQLRRDFGELGVDVAIELGAGRVGRVAYIIKLRIGAGAAQKIRQCLIGLERLGQFRPVQGGEPAAIFFGEGLGRRLALLHVRRKLRIVRRGVEIGEIPFGETSKRGGGHVVSFEKRPPYGASFPLRQLGLKQCGR